MIVNRVDECRGGVDNKRRGSKCIIDILAVDGPHQCVCTCRALKAAGPGKLEDGGSGPELTVDYGAGCGIIVNIKLPVHHRVLYQDEVLSWCKSTGIGRHEFVLIRIIRICGNGRNLHIIVPKQPDLQAITWMTGGNAMDIYRVTVCNRRCTGKRASGR